MKDTYYKVLVKNVYGCFKEDSIKVGLETSISDFLTDDKTICENSTLQLKVSHGAHPPWKADPTLQCIQCAETTAKPDKSKYYYVTVTSANKCKYTDSVFVHLLTRADISTGEDRTVCKDEIFTLTGKGRGQTLWVSDLKVADETSLITTAKAEKSGPYILQTINDECKMTCQQCPQPFLKSIQQSTEYQVLVKDEFGCQLKQKIIVKVEDQCIGEGFYIPNIFTPYTKDGKNDDFRVYAEDKAEFINISIYDRWGEKIWSTQNIEETWNGHYKGRELAQGVYTYIVTARCEKTNNTFNFAGDITIID